MRRSSKWQARPPDIGLAIAATAIAPRPAQLNLAAPQHMAAIGSVGEALASDGDFIMTLLKKIIAAYLASAALAGPLVIGGYF